ncbi:winged helix-turn-helix domain-containing protein [Lentzea sp. NPDC051838]|uniref:ArsR/SmtB family transcription factor n=1 Tax=Lentzea sp. NPDC051838 TaxID=3154849 RepID=UPI00342DE52A
MPQLRIHFTDRDIARTRLTLAPDVLREIVGSAQILRQPGQAFGSWRRRVHELAVHDPELRTALRTVLSTRPGRLRENDGAVRVYFRDLVEPYLPMIEDALCTDVAAGIQRYLQCGPEGLLGVLGPATRWDPPVLSVDHLRPHEVHLGGQGIVLVPCYFALYHQIAPGPVLVCPIRTESRRKAERGDHVTALLGATRASILRSLVGGSTTCKLAKQVGVAPATVSHHTGVLREAGLIATEREENFARHLITPLGLRVLAADR